MANGFARRIDLRHAIHDLAQGNQAAARNASDLVLVRLAHVDQIEVAAAGNRDTAERARLLEQFQAALKACKEGDEKQKMSCQAAVQQVFAPGPSPKAN